MFNGGYNPDTKRKVIGQGTYGCIIKPAYTKSKNAKPSKVSKIGLIGETNDNEIKIGKIIRTIPKFKNFFSPILTSTHLHLHSTKQVETQDCHLVVKNEQRNPVPQKAEGNKYVVHTMDYVGKNRLEEHFIELLKSKPIQYIHSHLIQCHNHLLTAFIQLKKANLIHFDLNIGNVMITDKRNTPILIDFGLSFEAPEKGVSLKIQDTPFFTYSGDYTPWCIDIIVIAYYVQKKRGFLHKTTVDSSALVGLLDDQIGANGSVFSTYMNEGEQTRYRNNVKTYFDSWNGKSAMDLYQDLYKARFTWDNYAGTVLMLKLVKNMDLRSPLMDAYKNILIDVLTAAPNKRMDAAAVQSRINALPKTNIVHGQQKLNTNVEIGKKIKNIQSSIHYAKGQRQLLA